MVEQTKRYTPKGGGRPPARHLFMRGALRCFYREGAMLPRTARRRGRLYETYQCARNKTMGIEACAAHRRPEPQLRRPSCAPRQTGVVRDYGRGAVPAEDLRRL